MRIKVMGLPVKDQSQALDFYTNILGFVKKIDAPLSEGNRWLTVVSKYDQDGPQVLLEPAPNHFEPAKVFQEELFKAGIPYTGFYVDDVEKEYERLSKLGVEFSVKPTDVGMAIMAVFNDTCGNNIQLVEEK